VIVLASVPEEFSELINDCGLSVTDKPARTMATSSRSITLRTFVSIGSLIDRYPSLPARSPQLTSKDWEFRFFMNGVKVFLLPASRFVDTQRCQ
jgi:hypothetical protein